MPPAFPLCFQKGKKMGGAALIVLALFAVGVAHRSLKPDLQPTAKSRQAVAVPVSQIQPPASEASISAAIEIPDAETVSEGDLEAETDPVAEIPLAAPLPTAEIPSSLADKSFSAVPGGDGVDPVDPGKPLATARPSHIGASLTEMIGQMIVVGFTGDDAKDKGVMVARRELSQGLIGGVMHLGYNVRNAKQVAALNAGFRAASPKFAPLISLDQEGGKIQRLTKRKGFTKFPSAWAVAHPRGAVADPEARALGLYGAMAVELNRTGFNVNFGPVVDLNTYARNPIIGRYGRSFDESPDTVTAYSRAFAAAHRAAGILVSAKHFPGHGSSRTDSHKTFTDISTTWKAEEIEPYRTLAHDGAVDMIMVGHLYHRDFSDGPGIPASLSRKAIDIIRAPDGIGFDGVVVSDDMEMGALRNSFDLEDSVVRAVNAGIELLLFSNTAERDPELGARVNRIIEAAVNDNRIPRERIVNAYDRIVRMKGRLQEEKTAQSG